MELTFSQVEAVFAERFDIPPDRAVAFRGRLQHLQRMEFPEGSRTGRGTKAIYGWKQIVQLMVALDLLDLGLTPDVAARGVTQGTDRILGALYRVLLEFETETAFAKALKKARCPFAKTQIAVASAAALTFPQGTEPERAYVSTFAGPEFLRGLTADPAFEPTGAYIDLGSRLMLVAQLVGRKAELDPVETASSLFEWFREWANEDTGS